MTMCVLIVVSDIHLLHLLNLLCVAAERLVGALKRSSDLQPFRQSGLGSGKAWIDSTSMPL